MLTLTDVSVSLGGMPIVSNVDLSIGDGEIIGLLGPSGAGKSTLLRAIAGLVPLTAGTIAWDGQSLIDTPPHQRNFGFMFQDYALFPHRNVGGNVGFGLEMRGEHPAQVAVKVATALTWVGLAGMEMRPITSLSGGEQQRVALARALAPNPRLLLLDEPVGSLDRELRTRLIDELADMLKERQVTTIVVTHDQGEAFTLADRVAVMRTGRLIACEPPRHLWQVPPDEWTARFLGMTNIVSDPDRGRLLIRPEGITLAESGQAGVVSSAVFQEGRYRITVLTDDGWELSFATGEPVTNGTPVTVSIDPDSIVQF